MKNDNISKKRVIEIIDLVERDLEHDFKYNTDMNGYSKREFENFMSSLSSLTTVERMISEL